jgi:hypothetical protein
MLPSAGAAVYGTITVGALLAAESAKSESYGATVGAVALAIILVWIADSYSEFAEQRLEHRTTITLSGFAQALARELPIIAAAAIPLLGLLICWAAGVALTTAVTAAVWISAAMVAIEELFVGLRAGVRGRQLATQTALGALFGLAIIGLKLILRH